MAITPVTTSSIFLPSNHPGRYFVPADVRTYVEETKNGDYRNFKGLLERFLIPKLPDQIFDACVTVIGNSLSIIETGFCKGNISPELCTKVTYLFLKNQLATKFQIPETVELVCQDGSVRFNRSLLLMTCDFFKTGLNAETWKETPFQLTQFSTDTLIYFKNWLYGKPIDQNQQPLSFFLDLYILSDFLLHPSFGTPETCFEQLVFNEIQATKETNMELEELSDFLETFLTLKNNKNKTFIETKLLKMLLGMGGVSYDVINGTACFLPPDQLYLLNPSKPSGLSDALQKYFAGVKLTSLSDLTTFQFIKTALAGVPKERINAVSLFPITDSPFAETIEMILQPFDHLTHLLLPVIMPKRFQVEYIKKEKESFIVLQGDSLLMHLEALSNVLAAKKLGAIKVTVQILKTSNYFNANEIFIYKFSAKLEDLLTELNVNFITKDSAKTIENYSWIDTGYPSIKPRNPLYKLHSGTYKQTPGSPPQKDYHFEVHDVRYSIGQNFDPTFVLLSGD